MSDRRRMLIVICAARSGSKFLRDLLGVSAECAVVPYDINYVWRHGNESAPDDALPAEAAGERQIGYIRQVIPRMAGVRSARDGRLVVEKTVSNSLRVPFVARIFPEARYVHLVRDGRAVAESARRVWHEPPSSGYLFDKLRYFPVRNYRYALWYLRNRLRKAAGSAGPTVWGPRYPGIENDLGSLDLLQVCSRQWSVCLRSAETGLASLSRDSVYTIRYEDLVDDVGALAGLCKFAGILDDGAVLAARAARVAPSDRDKWRLKLTDAEISALERQIGPQLRDKGYDR